MEQYRVLIAEDDFRVSGIWQEFTNKVPEFKVVKEVKNGNEALNYIKSNKVDLIIMDVYMPDMDGIQLFWEIKKFDYPLDVIVISAAKETKIVKRLFRMGVIDYIIKPGTFERYQKALERFIKIRNTFSKTEINQNKLDNLIYNEFQKSKKNERELPKGLQQITLDKIFEVLKQNPFSRSAEEISKDSNLSIATTQRYLRFLAQENIIKKDLIYGVQGRPEHKYTLI